MTPNLTSIFFKGVGLKPPTRISLSRRNAPILKVDLDVSVGLTSYPYKCQVIKKNNSSLESPWLKNESLYLWTTTEFGPPGSDFFPLVTRFSVDSKKSKWNPKGPQPLIWVEVFAHHHRNTKAQHKDTIITNKHTTTKTHIKRNMTKHDTVASWYFEETRLTPPSTVVSELASN